MNAIVGYTEMAKKYVDDRDKVIDCMDKVATSGEYMLNMLNDVLEIARFDSGKMEISIVPFDIRDVKKELYIMLEEMASKKNLEFTIEDGDIEHEYVYGDKLHLNQIVMNLLTNAIKYTKPGGTVANTKLPFGIMEWVCLRNSSDIYLICLQERKILLLVVYREQALE